MKFTVITPAHNAGRWIADTLHSVRDQTHPAHEIIVINDASTDDTARAVRTSGVDVVYMETAFRNAASARNAGIQRATGDWIAFLDADDLWKPDHLAQCASTLAPGDVAYTAWTDTIDADGSLKIKGNCVWPVTTAQSNLTDSQYLAWYRTKHFFAMLTTVVRKDRFHAVGGFDETQLRRHDLDMWLRVIHGQRWAFNPASVARYRITTDGISRANWANSEYYHLRMLDKNYRQWPELQPEVQTWSRRSLAAALTDGTREDFRRAWPIAAPHLSPAWRAFFAINRQMPWAFRTANRLRRKLQGVPTA